MDRSSALSRLATLTALKPTGATTAADLEAARAALANSLLAYTVDPSTATTGLPTAPSASPPSEELRTLSRVLDTAAAAGPAAPVPLVFPRSLPALAVGNPALAPVSVGGMLPHSIGPFIDTLGALHWFDIFPAVQQTADSRTPSTVPVLLLPLALRAGPVPTTLPVSTGTLCMEAQLLASASPAGGYAGIAISGGTLEFSSVAIASTMGLQVDAATTLTLTITLGGSTGPTGGGDPGADGGAVVADMPATVTFVFTHTGAQITAAGDASLIAYGSTIGLQFQTAAPYYEPMLGQIFIPFKPNTTSFSALSVLSNLFQVTGTAKVDGGAWAIPVAVTPPAQLGAAASPGLPALVLGAGWKANWPRTSGGSTGFSLILLEASAGLLGLMAQTQNTRQLSMQIGLWPASPTSTARSSIDASFPSGALLYYESIGSFVSLSHVELLSCAAVLNSHIDRPVAADGSRFSSITRAVTLYETSSNNGAIVAGAAPAGTAQAPPIPVALQNALLVTTPPLLLIAAGSFGATPAEIDLGGLLLAFGLSSVLPTLPDLYAGDLHSGTDLPSDCIALVREGRMVYGPQSCAPVSF